MEEVVRECLIYFICNLNFHFYTRWKNLKNKRIWTSLKTSFLGKVLSTILKFRSNFDPVQTTGHGLKGKTCKDNWKRKRIGRTKSRATGKRTSNGTHTHQSFPSTLFLFSYWKKRLYRLSSKLPPLFWVTLERCCHK